MVLPLHLAPFEGIVWGPWARKAPLGASLNCLPCYTGIRGGWLSCRMNEKS